MNVFKIDCSSNQIFFEFFARKIYAKYVDVVHIKTKFCISTELVSSNVQVGPKLSQSTNSASIFWPSPTKPSIVFSKSDIKSYLLNTHCIRDWLSTSIVVGCGAITTFWTTSEAFFFEVSKPTKSLPRHFESILSLLMQNLKISITFSLWLQLRQALLS